MTIVLLATGGSSGAPRLVAEYVVGADPCGHKTTVTPVLTDASGCRSVSETGDWMVEVHGEPAKETSQ